MKTLCLVFGVLSLMLTGTVCFGQEIVSSDKYVTREEYNKLLKEVEVLKGKLEIQGEKKVIPAPPKQDMSDELEAIKSLVTSVQPGDSKFLMSGYGFGGYNDLKGSKNSYDAGFNPIFLWKLRDRLFFEAELELALNSTGTDLNLEYGNLSYILNDYMTVKAGKFLTPFGTFADRLHPKWINKLPDAPIALGDDGISPEQSVGFQVSGPIPVGPVKFNYALYTSNGPRLNTGSSDSKDTGRLNFTNNNDSLPKTFGGRLGVQTLPGLETGYSFYGSRVYGSVKRLPVVLQAVDLGYVLNSDVIKGVVDLRGQWVWSHVGRQIYDSSGSLGFGPLNFKNDREGGYLQAAYRPSRLNRDYIKNLEAVFRWDALNQASVIPKLADRHHWTLGLNYWLGPTAVIKVAYEFGTSANPSKGKRDSGLLLQTAIGF